MGSLGASAVAAVRTDHHEIAAIRTFRGPKRSARYPPGIWVREYPKRKELRTQPIVFRESENSLSMKWPAMLKFRRSRYVKMVVIVTRAIICHLTEVGRAEGKRAGSGAAVVGIAGLREPPSAAT